jgi:hypothetical protein
LDAVYLSGHARQRASEMGVPLTDVLAAMLNPEVAYEQADRGPGCWVHQRGRIAVAIRKTATEIVALSVLPRIAAVYSR